MRRQMSWGLALLLALVVLSGCSGDREGGIIRISFYFCIRQRIRKRCNGFHCFNVSGRDNRQRLGNLRCVP